MKLKSKAMAAIAAAALMPTSAFCEIHTFTSTAGSSIQGELVAVSGDSVTIKATDGRTINTKLASLSEADVSYVKSHELSKTSGPTSPAAATKESPFVNSLGMKFVPVPGTQVLFATKLVDVVQFDLYAAETPSLTAADGGLGGPGVPANEVSYDQAKGFCEWLSKKESLVYRLPTDREWSFAIGIATLESATAVPEELDGKLKGVYPWGSSWPPPNGYANYCDEAYRDFCKKNGHEGGPHIPGYRDGEYAISLTGAFPANKLGLHDMSGNLMAWCDGWYDKLQTRRFLRGSMWGNAARDDLLSSSRRELDMGKTTEKDLPSAIRVVLELPKP
ncbi:MAG: SUMF1/EgtB/PvdO family nonheme iron enzyme [Verrucomicrobiaceae bacterium]|nr:SUMF1/EgtB/PvdO family nonheme iron enzyme [Verrucomicrobiaceae bacterium]